MDRLNITLDEERAEKLTRLAARMHLQPGTVARSLLAHALDESDPDPRDVVHLLDGIPGAYERAQLGLRQATTRQRSPWVPSSTLREIVEEAGADPGLLDDLAAVRGELVDDA